MQEENYISGVHNWCDRWCEKCRFITRCAVGAMELEMQDAESEEEANQKMIDHLQQAAEMIQEYMDKMGIDPEEIDPEWEAEYEAKENVERIIRKTHPVSTTGNDYGKTVHEWFISEEGKQLIAQLTAVKAGNGEGLEIRMEPAQCFEIIRYYEFFIGAKCARMVAEAEDDYWHELPVHERSYNGTAKVTLIAIDRSLLAWFDLMHWAPEHKSRWMPFIDQLSQLKKLVNAYFPDAQLFIRPGFDE
jgi:hypothetical protein